VLAVELVERKVQQAWGLVGQVQVEAVEAVTDFGHTAAILVELAMWQFVIQIVLMLHPQLLVLQQ
jgi:hypothetical protein